MNFKKIITGCILFMLIGASVYAQSEDTSSSTRDVFKKESTIIIDEPIRDNSYLLAARIAVLSEIKGSFWGIAQTIETGAQIKKNFFGIAVDVDIKDRIGGDLYLVAKKAMIGSEVSAESYIIAEDVLIKEDMGDDLNIIASRVILNGDINDDVYIRADEIYINTYEITGDLKLYTSKLYMTDNLNIEGDFIVNDKLVTNIKDYRKYELTDYKNTQIPTSFDQLPSNNGVEYLGLSKIKNTLYASFGLFTLFILLGDVLAAIIVFKLFPLKMNLALKHLSSDVSEVRMNILYGAIFLLGGVVAILFCVFTIVGLPLAILLGLFIILILQLSKYLGMYKIGSIFVEKVHSRFANNVFINALIGELVLLILILFLALIPFIGDYLIAIFAIVYTVWLVGSVVRVKLSSVREVYSKK